MQKVVRVDSRVGFLKSKFQKRSGDKGDLVGVRRIII